MNERDSEHVAAQFLDQGYSLAQAPKDADVILLNTCSVRQHAEDKVWSELGRLRKLKIPNHKFQITNKFQIPDSKLKNKSAERTPQNADRTPVIGVIGCMAENLKNKIIERMPIVDFVAGPNDVARLVAIVETIKKTKKKIVAVGSAQRDASFYRHLYHAGKKHSYVVIMEGCNNFCSYCVVPYVRGRERSRPAKDVIAEIEQLVLKGVASVTLLGQNVNSYSGGCNFAELLRKVSAIKGLKEISFATSHPKDATQELFEAMRDCPTIIKYLHLPLQSGSGRILRKMNRGYTKARYEAVVAQYRKIVGEGALIGTDIIVGFPTETEKDFSRTVAMMEKIRFDQAFLFKYSPRPGTKAAEFADDVSLEEKKRRHAILLELQRKISNEKKVSR